MSYWLIVICYWGVQKHKAKNQRTEDGWQRTEGRKTEDRWRTTEDGGWSLEHEDRS